MSVGSAASGGVDKWAAERTKLALLSVKENGDSLQYHTFHELGRLTNQFANTLRSLDIARGEQVLIIVQSIPQWYVAMIDMFKLDVVPMPGTALLTTKDIAYRVNRVEASMVITDLAHVRRVDEVAKMCPHSAPAHGGRRSDQGLAQLRRGDDQGLALAGPG